MLGRTDSRRRLLFLLVTFAVIGAALFARLAYWQVVKRDDLAQEAFAQTTMRQESPSRRGDIFDRSGVVVLATTVDRERLAAIPSELSPRRRAEVAEELVKLLGLEVEDAAVLTERMMSDRKYVVLAHGLERATADRVRAAAASGRIEGVLLESEPVRVYPHEGGGPDSTLAAHLLGFVNRDGIGQYGVEQYYQEQLGGRPRVVHAQRDVAARAIPDTVVVEDDGSPGEDLRLTIDAGLQLAVEQEVLAAWAADEAKSVSALVMDPYTGEILAEASYPSYDANDYRAIAAIDPSRFIDPVVSSLYEPGSVFKMLTAIAGLETKTVTTKTKIKDVGTLKLDKGRTHVDDADRRGMGWMTFEDAIAYSRNVVAAKVALQLGDTTAEASQILHETWLRLGFGATTGVDVSGEVRGLVNDPAITKWQQIDLANGSFGQGVAVTPIQLATAFSAMVNGGTLVQPHVVKAIGSRDLDPPSRGQVITPNLSRTLTGMMKHVVREVPFYRDRTLIKGYEVGGKTGTAQIWDPSARDGKGAWKHNLFNYSFVGYIAREPGIPDLVVAVKINEGTPTVARVGQLEMPVMSFELFRRIAHDAITRPGLLPERRDPSGTVTAER
ncbi:MAG TPA: penicillin-binding protein 2 [Candidatus Limnocylindrales bacterium]|nr:penicillin-binding protein 2 [Candidatus Limnocylindrales bacterium]